VCSIKKFYINTVFTILHSETVWGCLFLLCKLKEVICRIQIVNLQNSVTSEVFTVMWIKLVVFGLLYHIAFWLVPTMQRNILPPSSALKMEAPCSSKTLAHSQNCVWHINSEDHHLYLYRLPPTHTIHCHIQIYFYCLQTTTVDTLCLWFTTQFNKKYTKLMHVSI
jgi:hypothetical protein